MIIRTGLFLDNEKRPYNEMLTVLDTEPRHGASSEGPPPCHLAAWRRCIFLNGMEEEAPPSSTMRRMAFRRSPPPPPLRPPVWTLCG